MSVELLVRAILVISLALFTAACGGGGGGGSDAPATTPTNNDSATSTEGETGNTGNGDNSGDNSGDTDAGNTDGGDTSTPYTFTATQFRYLPLANGTSIQYNDGSSASTTLDTNEFNGKGVYAVSNSGTTLYLSSTPTKIALHGVDGSFSIATPVGNVTVTKLRFYNTLDDSLASIPLLYSTTPEGQNVSITETTATAKATTSLGTYTVSPFTTTSSFENTELSALAYGALPSRKITLSMAGTANTPFGAAPVGFGDTIYLANGIGIVKRDSNDYNIHNEITGLQGLPTTIWFDHASGSPAIATGSEATFSIAGGSTISSSTYRIANQSDINAMGWISVQEDTASQTFNVSMSAHADLPSTLTSVEIIFENLQTNERLSGNVTIQP